MRDATLRDFAALTAFLDERVRAPLAWGRHDEVTFAAEAARLVAGCELKAALGCRWRSAAGAAKAIEGRGGLAAAIDAHLPRVVPALAHRGDLGLAEWDGRQVLVVVEGQLLATAGATGLIRLPRRALVVAWSVSQPRDGGAA